MAKIQVELNVKLKIVVDDHTDWAVDYGLSDDSVEAVRADVESYFSHDGISDGLRNDPNKRSLSYRIIEARDDVVSVKAS